VQVRLVIHHDNNDDACEAWIHDTVRIDLAKVAERYHKDYPGSPGIVAVNLASANADDTEKLKTTFEFP
jgi:hypothetical protein